MLGKGSRHLIAGSGIGLGQLVVACNNGCRLVSVGLIENSNNETGKGWLARVNEWLIKGRWSGGAFNTLAVIIWQLNHVGQSGNGM